MHVPLGKKVADIYAELNLDKDAIRRAMVAAGGEMGADADRLGRTLGDRMSQGIAEKVEQSSARLAKARRAEESAADAVRLAEVRLDEVRKKAEPGSSRLLAAEQKLEGARRKQVDATSAIQTAERNLARDRNTLANAVQKAAAAAGPNADRAGRELGGKLSQGIHLSIVRNSPLIAAAIGAALVAGGPVMLAGAGVLFGGIATLAAAQSTEVQRAWRGTFESISLDARRDAEVLIPTLTGIATRVGDAFDRMRPQISEAFSEAGPLIDDLADGLLGLVENALPGMLDAVREGDVVFEGLRDMLESVGTGLSDFFSILSEHSDAGGEVFASIGEILENLLPILGELLGAGSEVARVILPAFAAALSVVSDALEVIAPILPIVVTAIGSFKVAQTAVGWLGALGGALERLGGRGALGSAAGGAKNFGSAVSAAAKLSVPLAIAVAGIAAAMATASKEEKEYETNLKGAFGALREGGQAAEDARHKIDLLRHASEQQGNGLFQEFTEFIGISPDLDGALQEAEENYRAVWDAMTPLQQAQSKVAEWTQTLTQRLQDENATTEDVAAAKRRLAAWQDSAAEAARNEEEAVRGSAIAMEDAATAADNLMAALDAMNGGHLDLREAQRQFQEAIDKANDALKENGRVLDIGTEAGRENQAALDGIASSAMDVAESLYETTGDYGRFRDNLQGARDDLYEQAIAFGMSEEGARKYVDEVLSIPPEWRTVAEFDTTTAQGEIDAIINYLKQQEPGATINLGVISEDAYNALDALGIEVNAIPDGTVEVILDDKATGVLDDIDARTVTPTVDADGEPLHTKVDKAMATLGDVDSYWARATLDADDKMLKAKTEGALAGLRDLADQEPTPVLDAEDKMLKAKQAGAMAGLRNLADQRPTPPLDADGGPLGKKIGDALAGLRNFAAQRPTPALGAKDNASGVINGIIGRLAGVQSKTVTVTTVQRTIIEGIISSGVSKSAFGATGGAIENGQIKHFDIGGAVQGGPPGVDTVRAAGPLLGVDYRLDNGEHILDRHDVGLMGGQAGVYAFRAALNAGRPQVVMPGGAPDQITASAATAASTTILVDKIVISGTFDMASSQDLRRAAETLRDEIVKLERAHS